jgi:hypothetical protein
MKRDIVLNNIYKCFSYLTVNRGSAVGIATVGWTPEGPEFESREWQEFSPLHVVQTSSGAHPASYKMGTWGCFDGVMRPGHEADHSPSTSAEVKNTWIYTSTPPLHGSSA